MKLSAHDLKQIDENTPSKLSHEQLIFFSLNLISDLKEARQLLKEQPKAATQHNKEEPKFDSILINNIKIYIFMMILNAEIIWSYCRNTTKSIYCLVICRKEQLTKN